MVTIDLSGRVALVTGASSGLGAGIARCLARAGAAVIVNYHRSEEGAARVAGEIEAAGGRALPVRADVADPEQARAMLEQGRRAFGPVTVVINNAVLFASELAAFVTGAYLPVCGGHTIYA